MFGDPEVKGDRTQHRDIVSSVSPHSAAATFTEYPLLTVRFPNNCKVKLYFLFFFEVQKNPFYFAEAWRNCTLSMPPSRYLFNTCGAVGDSVRADVSHGERLCVHSNRPPHCTTPLSFIWSSGACWRTARPHTLTQTQKSDCLQGSWPERICKHTLVFFLVVWLNLKINNNNNNV